MALEGGHVPSFRNIGQKGPSGDSVNANAWSVGEGIRSRQRIKTRLSGTIGLRCGSGVQSSSAADIDDVATLTPGHTFPYRRHEAEGPL